MKIKTSEASPLQLDWAVSEAEGCSYGDYFEDGLRNCRTWSTDWSQGGPIIERERINIRDEVSHWASWMWDATRCGDVSYYGPTPLIAAMRCFVASKLGDEVDVPDELLGD